VNSTTEEIRPGHPEFIFVGGHPAIDFANTFSTPNGEGTEHLHAWADVIDWLSLAGLSKDRGLILPAARGAEELRSVIELRQDWAAELARLVAGEKVGDKFLERVNRLLAEDIFHEKLRCKEGTRYRLVRSGSQLQGQKLALVLLGRQIAVFLAEANLSYLHRCANTTSCVLYFYDTTKNHRRQWCSVASCGNRHKVAQFRKRQVKTSAPSQ
jgi:predicted RNA-binding Zn ribbon-like protein